MRRSMRRRTQVQLEVNERTPDRSGYLGTNLQESRLMDRLFITTMAFSCISLNMGGATTLNALSYLLMCPAD